MQSLLLINSAKIKTEKRRRQHVHGTVNPNCTAHLNSLFLKSYCSIACSLQLIHMNDHATIYTTHKIKRTEKTLLPKQYYVRVAKIKVHYKVKEKERDKRKLDIIR